jgi:hypothetical protein
MKNFHSCLATLFVLAACSTHPQSQSPYTGQESREIKALSQAEVDGLLNGKGLGFAKSAELNGYPGPAHVLELSAQLALSPEQLKRTHEIFARMESSAKAHGAELVEAERDLEAQFRSHQVTPQSLDKALARVAALQAKVRSAHLTAHIEQTQLLTPGQIARYSSLRGYGGGHGHAGHR